MNKIFEYCLFSVFLLISTSLFGQSTVKTFDIAKQVAVQENKLIVVDLGFVGCVPCAEMDKLVFTDTSLQKVLRQHFVFFKSDIMKDHDGKILARKYGASGFPTFIILNNQGKAILTESGFIGVAAFTALLHKAIALNNDRSFLAFDDDLNKNYPAAYSERYIKTGHNHDFSELAYFLDETEDLFSEQAFLANSATSFPKYTAWYYDNLYKLKKMYGEHLLIKKTNAIVLKKSQIFGKTNNADSLRKMLVYVKPVYNDKSWNYILPVCLNNYYQANADLSTYLNFISEFCSALDWKTQSEIYFNILLDKPKDKESVSRILAVYDERESTSVFTFGDYYSKSLLNFYLGNYEKANATAHKLFDLEYAASPWNFKKEDIEYLIRAIHMQDLSNYKPKSIHTTNPMTFVK